VDQLARATVETIRAICSAPGRRSPFLHVWELAPGHPILTAHVLVAHDADCHAVRRALERMLKERLTIAHTTLQVDHAQAQLLSIQRQGVWPSTTT